MQSSLMAGTASPVCVQNDLLRETVSSTPFCTSLRFETHEPGLL